MTNQDRSKKVINVVGGGINQIHTLLDFLLYVIMNCYFFISKKKKSLAVTYGPTAGGVHSFDHGYVTEDCATLITDLLSHKHDQN